MELQFDLTNLLAKPGEAQRTGAEKAMKTLLANPHGWPLGWIDLDARKAEIPEVNDALDSCSGADTLVTIGMGGSGLGTRALASLFAASMGSGIFQGANGRRLVVLDNLDEANAARVREELAGAKAALNPVSKSGTTLETIANLLTLLSSAPESHLVATTGDPDSPIGRLAAARHAPILLVPDDVGGRFSVLTSVGLFPLGFIGVDVAGLLEGAAGARDAFIDEAADSNPALELAAHIFSLHRDRAVSQMFFLPYCEAMYDFGRWWQQLFAESLGKRKSLDGRDIFTGLTPVAALGPSDQHSLLQLLLEGPDDKLTAFIEVEKPSRDAGAFAAIPPELAEFSYLRGKRIHDIVRAELAGTRQSLANQGRPNYTLTLPSLSTRAVGEMLFFFMLVTGLLGVMFNVNAFDQPAVQESKQLTRRNLSS